MLFRAVVPKGSALAGFAPGHLHPPSPTNPECTPLRAQRQPAERMSASEFCWINTPPPRRRPWQPAMQTVRRPGSGTGATTIGGARKRQGLKTSTTTKPRR
ncbi:hypothetical protein FCH79_01025 [Pseudomonas koreensis]|nr:hypothetical protein [Pseudomonas koreensis]